MPLMVQPQTSAAIIERNMAIAQNKNGHAYRRISKSVFEQSAAHSEKCKKRPINRRSPRQPLIDEPILLRDLLCNFRISPKCAFVFGHAASNHHVQITGFHAAGMSR